MKIESLEDTWQDILLKAKRGLELDVKALAQASGLPEEKITSLLAGKFNEATLAAIAPILGLHPRELLMIASETAAALPPPLHDLPKNFKRFTTTYHEMQVHSYLLWSEKNKKAIAFDTGTDLAPLLRELHRHQIILEAIFLTHAHSDHVLKLSELLKKTTAHAWIDQAELIKDAQPLSSHFSYHLDDSIIIEAHSTPGHSSGGTTYFIRGLSRSVAVVGDTIFARSVGGIAPAAYVAGLKNIRNTILSLPASTILAPGHGPLTTVEEEFLHNPFFSSYPPTACFYNGSI